MSRLQFMRRYTRAISSFKKSLTAITFDGSLVAFILALYSVFFSFFWGGGLLNKTFELQGSKCKTLIKETCHKFNSKIACCNLTKKNANDFQKVIYRCHVRWIIGGLYCGLVQFFLGLLIKTFEFQSSKCKTLIKETCHKFNSKIACCNLTKKNANDFQKVIYRCHVRWIIGGLYCGLVQFFLGLLIKTFEFQSSKCKTLIKETCHKFNSKVACCNLTKKMQMIFKNSFIVVTFESLVAFIVALYGTFLLLLRL